LQNIPLHCSVHITATPYSLDPDLSHMNPVHIPIACFVRSISILSFHVVPRPPKWFLPFIFSH
jgi:hypothetical protein